MSDLDKKVTMTVEEYTLTTNHPGRRGSPAVFSGTTVYVIRYASGGFFTYSYMSYADAGNAVQMMREQGTDTERYRQFNVVMDPERTLHVAARS